MRTCVRTLAVALVVSLASAATASEDAKHRAPCAPMSPSALKVSTVLPARDAIGSFSASVNEKAAFTSSRCVLIAVYSAASPRTSSVAEAEQLALALAEA